MKIKKFISLLASLAMMVTAVTGAMTASASEVASGTCGDLTWTLDSDGKLTLSGEGEMASPDVQDSKVFAGASLNGPNSLPAACETQLKDYPEIYTYQKYAKDIKEVEIKEGVTSIGFAAFYKMPNLETVVLPKTISEFKGIGYAKNIQHDSHGAEPISAYASMAFAECTKLKNLTLAEGMTAIGSIAFYGCTALESVRIPSTILCETKSSSGTDLESNYGWGPFSFVGCTSLKDITLPEGLTVIGGAAFENTGVESVVIPSTIKTWDTINTHACDEQLGMEAAQNYNVAFADCKNLSSVTFADGLSQIGYVPFSGCPKLTRVFVPKSITSMTYAFANSDIQEVCIEEGTVIGTYDAGGNRQESDGFNFSFNNCKKLKKFEIFSGIVTIFNNAKWYTGCTSLTDFYVHGMESSLPSDLILMNHSVTIHCDYGSKLYNAYTVQSEIIKDDIENALKELNTAVTEAEKYSEEDYTTESYGVLQTALENAKKYDENYTGVLPIEWAADDIMTAIEGLEEKKDEPSSSDPSSSNPSDNSSDPSNSSDNNNQSQSPNTPATPPTSAPTTATPKPTTPPIVTTTAAKPAKVKAVKLTAKKKKLNVSWKKVSGAMGYEVLSATNNKFTKNKKTVTVKKNKVTLKKLKPKKKYFVKVRAYKLASGRKYFGKWSKVVKKKTK